MINDQFTLDLSKEVGKISQIETFNRKFARYEVMNITGKDYIVGANKDRRGIFSNFEDYKMLFSLFFLVKSPLPRFFDDKYLASTIPVEDMLLFCKDYGLPYEDPDLWKNYRLAGFEVGNFRYRTAFLYSLFLLWKALFLDDEAGINLNMLLVGLKPEDFVGRKEKVAKTKEMLATYITVKGNGFNLQLVYDASNDRFVFKLRARDIFDVFYYQLATLVTNDKADFKGNLKICKSKRCGAYFWGHGNKEYCDRCDRRTVWSRENPESRQPKGGSHERLHQEKQ